MLSLALRSCLLLHKRGEAMALEYPLLRAKLTTFRQFPAKFGHSNAMASYQRFGALIN